MLSYIYVLGYGVPQGYAEAVRWWRRAAEQGNANAQSRLGILYDMGQGVPQDYAEAVRWWRRAAEQGNANAQFFLGDAYRRGQGVAQNYIQAYMFANLAATNLTGEGRELSVELRGLLAAKRKVSQTQLQVGTAG